MRAGRRLRCCGEAPVAPDQARGQPPRHHSIFSDGVVTIGDCRCRPAERCAGAEEASDRDSIALLRSGVFAKHVRGETIVADTNHAIFFGAGREYRVSHPVCDGDNCTTFTLERSVMMELVAAHDPGAAGREGSLLTLTHAPCDARAYLLHRRLYQSINQASIAEEAVAELVFDLLDALLAAAYADRRPRRRAPGPATSRAHRELVERAKLVLSERWRDRLLLEDVARAVHASPYHLSRVFTAHTGLSVHRYLSRLRLRAALDGLADPAADLSRLALRSGFADHSHLTNAFRREFGETPSRARQTLGLHELREMSRNLQV